MALKQKKHVACENVSVNMALCADRFLLTFLHNSQSNLMYHSCGYCCPLPVVKQDTSDLFKHCPVLSAVMKDQDDELKQRCSTIILTLHKLSTPVFKEKLCFVFLLL